jgi:hypothetical protein
VAKYSGCIIDHEAIDFVRVRKRCLMKTSNYKKWLYSGLTIIVVSTLGAILGIGGGIYYSFDALKTNESAGIGAVGGGIYAALVFDILFLITGLIGTILLVIGCIKGYQHSRSLK